MINHTVNNFRGGRNMYSNILGLLIVVIAVVSISEAAFSQTCSNPKGKVYILRHAHKCEDSSRFDVKISCDPGHKMANDLVTKMQGEDVQISTIYTTNYPRTKQTAAPLANSIEGVELEDNYSSSTLLEKMCVNESEDESVNAIVVVGHSGKIPTILRELCRYTENTDSNDCQNYTQADIEYCDLYVFDFDGNPKIFREDRYCPYTNFPRTAPCMTESWCPTTNSE